MEMNEQEEASLSYECWADLNKWRKYVTYINTEVQRSEPSINESAKSGFHWIHAKKPQTDMQT